MGKICYIIFFILLAFISCEPPKNNPPQIINLTCSDDDLTIYGGEHVFLMCEASDPEGDKISYNWTASTGTFNSLTSASVTWTSPVVRMESVALITVQINDAANPDKPQSQICWIKLNPNPIVEPDPEPEPAYYIKYVCDDAYVDVAHPDAKSGDELNLFTGPGYYTYLRFDIRDIYNYINRYNLSSIEKVEIRLAKGYNNTVTKPIGTTALYGISWSESSWFEELISYNTRPQYGNKIAEVQNITFDIDGVVAFNVMTDFLNCVQLHTHYSVMVSTPSPNVGSYCSFYSKELKDRYPEYGDAATPVLWIKYILK